MGKIAIDLGIIKIYWYSIFILLAIIFGYLIIKKETKKQNLSDETTIDLIFYSVITGIIGTNKALQGFETKANDKGE